MLPVGRALGVLVPVFSLASILVILTRNPSAHELSQSESTIRVDGPAVHVQLSLNLLALAGVDANGDTRVSYEELDHAIEHVFEVIKAHYVLRAPDAPTAVVVERHDVTDDHVLRIAIRYTFNRSVTRLEVTSTFDAIAGADHQHVVTATIDDAPQRSLLDGGHRTVSFHMSGLSLGRLAATIGAILVLLALVLLRLGRHRKSREGSRP